MRPEPPRPTGSEHRRCDACGLVALCVTIPLRRAAPNATGALCIACLQRTLGDLASDRR